MSRERRIHPRSESRLSAGLQCGGDSVEGVVENVGAGGVFFATEQLDIAVDQGDEVVVVMRPADGAAAVECAGVVLRGDRYFDGARVVRAFAIRFHEDIDPVALGLSN